MQTKLALLFVLHVLALGVLFARRGVALKAWNLLLLLTYLFVFYAAWGVAMQAVPGIYVPEASGDGAGSAQPAAGAAP